LDVEQLNRLLVDLGLGKTEASCYLQLLLMADQGPATAYQVAKQLGKNPNTVYNALDELERRGAVEVSTGRGKEYRPISAEMLTDILKKDYNNRILYAEAHLRALPRPAPTHEVLQIATCGVAVQRFIQLVADCRQVAVLDLAPALLGAMEPHLAGLLRNNINVVARLYEEPHNENLTKFENFIFTVEPDGAVLQQLMPGLVMRGVFDCRTQVSAYLPADVNPASPRFANRPLPQAMWTASPLLAYQAHNGLASEIIHTELRAMLRAGNDPGEMQTRQDWLARKIHQPVDWEGFWKNAGLGSSQEQENTAVARPRTPWSPGARPQEGRPQDGRSQDAVAEKPAAYLHTLAAELLVRKRRAGR
jgi:sugar-specific transcriptional regulator TrmB